MDREMIFDPSNLPFSDVHKLMIGSIVPRPIAFVSTVSNKGERNIAPFSYFNGVCSNPPTIMFAPARRGWDGKEKDTLVNIKQNQEFVVNIVSEKITEQMVACSTDYNPDVDEFDISGLHPQNSTKVTPPKLRESLISFECKLNQIVEIGTNEPGSGFIVIGTIVLFHIDESIYDNGHIKLEKLKPIGRLAGNWYTRPTDNFEIIRKVKP
tara:strand:+ start:3733 stop:4362 length:630 start_codon:yes stop_codon:yes gene_type:complete